jgi:glycosyltransferase involved in cell wall biosynthesis
LQPRRYERPNLSFDLANYAVLHGNRFTAETYAYLKKPLFLISTSSALEIAFPEGRNVDACRRNFLWLGSGGMVHKGLDLVLEAFAGRPNLHLTVCGPVKQEKDFEKAYFRELYETSNINTVGWIDVTSSKFSQIAQGCIGLVYPSSSEGQAGSVVTALNAGLIPIVSYQSGVDVQDFGLVLEECSIGRIQSTLDVVSNWPAEKLEEMAYNAWEYARKNHTRQVFAENYRRIIEQILSNQNHRPSP